MAIVYSVIYTHAGGATFSFKCKNPQIIIKQPGKSIERQPNKIGIVVDPNQPYRFVKCSAFVSAAEYQTLRAMLMPAAKPTYDGDDPKVEIKLSGAVSETFLCAILSDVPAFKHTDDKIKIFAEFTERSA